MRSDLKSEPTARGDSLSIEVGRWFRARATGWGVAALAAVAAAVVAAEIARWMVR
jgi:hypothetical protein